MVKSIIDLEESEWNKNWPKMIEDEFTFEVRIVSFAICMEIIKCVITNLWDILKEVEDYVLIL